MKKGKRESYDKLYVEPETRDGQKKVFKMSAERNQIAKDVKAVRTVMYEKGNVLRDDDGIKKRWRSYYERLMNEENE